MPASKATLRRVARNKKLRAEITALTKRMEAAMVEGDQGAACTLLRDIKELEHELNA